MSRQTTAEDSGASKAMTELQNKWYNALVSELQLDEKTFQLAQGTPQLNTSEAVWTIFDTVPPKSLTHNFHSSPNSFYSDYRSLVFSIQSLKGNPFKKELGLDYKKWKLWLKKNQDKIGPDTTKMDLFKSWASINLSPGKEQKAIEAMRRIQHNTVNEAQKLVAKNGPSDSDSVAPYNEGINDLIDATKGESRSFTFDSDQEKSDVEHTWAEGETGFLFDFFHLGGSGGYDKVSKEAASSTVKMDVTFDNITQPAFSTKPAGWFDSSALGLAYNNKDAWVNNADWDDFFGDDGMLKRYMNSLVAVSGMSATLTVERSFSKDVRKKITSEGGLSIWPFFSIGGSGGHTSHVTFTEDDHLKVHWETDDSDLMVLGVNVSSIDGMFG